MKIVLDTHVLVSGILSPHGPPAAVLRALLSGRAGLCFDERILTEYRDVLTRGKFAFDADAVADLLGFLESAGEHILAEPLHVQIPDPGDGMFIEVAKAAQAELLVTGNMKHFPKASRMGCRVVTPREALDELV